MLKLQQTNQFALLCFQQTKSICCVLEGKMDQKKKENRRVRLTKQAIQDSLIELLDDKPIEKISISELCQIADINRTTFYNHYGSQYDVLNEVGENIASRIVRSAAQESECVSVSLETQVCLICHYLQGHPVEANILLKYFTADDTVIRDMLLQRLSDGRIRYSDFTERYDENTKKLLFHFLIHGIYNLIRCWILEGIDKTPEDIGALAADIALHGWLRMEHEVNETM